MIDAPRVKTCASGTASSPLQAFRRMAGLEELEGFDGGQGDSRRASFGHRLRGQAAQRLHWRDEL